MKFSRNLLFLGNGQKAILIMSVIEYKACRSLMVVLIMRLICSAGTPFGLNNSAGLRPLNLLQVRLQQWTWNTASWQHALVSVWHIDTPLLVPLVLLVPLLCLYAWNNDELCLLVHSSTVLLTFLHPSTTWHKPCNDQLLANCSRSDILRVGIGLSISILGLCC